MVNTHVIPIEQKKLLIGAKTHEEFLQRMITKFPSENFNPSKIYNMWYNRERHIKEVESHVKALHTVMVPREIKTRAGGAQSPSMPDDELFVKIHNDMRELIEVQKEMLSLFKKLDKGDGRR